MAWEVGRKTKTNEATYTPPQVPTWLIPIQQSGGDTFAEFEIPKQDNVG